MIVKLDIFPPGLIQTVRLAHAIMEAGVTVSVDQVSVPAYEYLAKFFPVRFTTNGATAKIADASLDHQIPFVRVGAITVPLLYAHAIPERSRTFWSAGVRTPKPTFTGFMPPFRRQALRSWRRRGAAITATANGRREISRYWDETFLRRMGHSQFVLCPDGGYPWSYRFFEAILCGATPIVQTPVACYEGFYYHNWRDKHLERKNVEENFNLAVKRLTLPHETIRENICTKP